MDIPALKDRLTALTKDTIKPDGNKITKEQLLSFKLNDNKKIYSFAFHYKLEDDYLYKGFEGVIPTIKFYSFSMIGGGQNYKHIYFKDHINGVKISFPLQPFDEYQTSRFTLSIEDLLPVLKSQLLDYSNNIHSLLQSYNNFTTQDLINTSPNILL